MNHLVDKHLLINSTRIAHGVQGAGTPVVLIHGTPSSSLIWRNIAPALVEAGFRVHVFDLLGYGLSERPWDPDVDTSITGQVSILEGLMAHWGLNAAHIVAHDIGGGIAQRLAVFSPEKVRSLTLIDSVSFDSYPSKRTRQQMEEGLERLVKRPDSAHREHFREWLLSAVHDEERLTHSALETYVDLISGPVGQGSLFQHQVRHYDPKHTLEISPRLAELGKLPVQIIWGENDAWQVTDWARRLQESIPNSELHIVPDCGHFAMEDQPEKISQKLISFLAAQSG